MSKRLNKCFHNMKSRCTDSNHKGYKQGYEDCQKEIEESLGLLWKGGAE